MDSPVVRAVMQALAKEPAQRPSTCAALTGEADAGPTAEPAARDKETAPVPEPARASKGALTPEETAAHFAAAV